MPAADITEVSITFGNGIKREEYGPVKKAEVTIRAIVQQGEDGVVALNYISRIAEAKCKELLLGTAAPVSEEQPLPPTSSASPGSTSEAGEPQRRTRRTKEQIAIDEALKTGKAELVVSVPTEADAAAAEAARSPSAAEPAASPGPTISEEPPAEAEPVIDEWDVGETAPAITDLELNHACSETAGRTKKPLDVKATINSFSPATDEFNVEKGGRKFAVNDIPQSQRADFLAKLKALT